jgi:D-glycero-D-manno-heptose 1,7-bisphosphate phosphatase
MTKNRRTSLKKALFLDRDGIINIDYGYVHKKENFIFTEGIFDLLKLFTGAGYTLFIVTNQSGIGRGYYTEDDFTTLTRWMLEQFALHHIHITQVFFCPHTPEEGCCCRKPAAGMIETYLKKYPIDLENSWMIGDKQSDIDFAHNAKIKHTIAISSKKIDRAEYIFSSIPECKRFLEKNQGRILL